MRYVICISVLVCFNLQPRQAALEHSPGGNQNESTGDGYPSHEKPLDAICKEKTFREIVQCLKDLIPLAVIGFPWAPSGMTDQIRHQQNQSRHLGDAMDPINHVCEVFENFLKCLDQHAVRSECMVAGDGSGFIAHTVFQFVCHIQPRRNELRHSL